MTQVQQSPDALAQTIAEAFGEEEQIKLYQYVCRHYETAMVKRAFNEAQRVPSDKIKKSRSALFFHLLKKYDQEND